MGEIGRAAARAFQLGILSGEQEIDLPNQRQHFVRGVLRKTAALAGDGFGDFLSQPQERTQAEAELQPCREAEKEGEPDKTCRQIREKMVAGLPSRVRSLATAIRAGAALAASGSGSAVPDEQQFPPGPSI